MSGRGLVLVLQALTLLGSALTAVKLYRSGLYLHYRVFFAYFLFRVPNGIWSLVLPANSKAYFYCWVFSEPLFWIFEVLVVRELIGLVLERHKGLYTLGRWAMYFGIVVSVALSVLSMEIKFTPATPLRSRAVIYVLGTDRGVHLCLAIFLILMVFLISRYPVPLGRNTILHAVLFTTYFLGSSLTSLLRSVLGIRLFATIDTGLMALAAACTFGWFLFLTPKGEEVEVNVPHLSADREERILYHLDSLNAALLKVSRK
jgi:hypothetical protein